MRDTDGFLPSLHGAGSKPVAPRSIESSEILGGSSHVFILHAGYVYTLRRTREDKLILTK